MADDNNIPWLFREHRQEPMPEYMHFSIRTGQSIMTVGIPKTPNEYWNGITDCIKEPLFKGACEEPCAFYKCTEHQALVYIPIDKESVVLPEPEACNETVEDCQWSLLGYAYVVSHTLFVRVGCKHLYFRDKDNVKRWGQGGAINELYYVPCEQLPPMARFRKMPAKRSLIKGANKF